MRQFHGSLAILIILIICCWPAAIIYFVMKYDDEIAPYPTRTCTCCGANIPMNYQVCPHCGKPTNPYPGGQQYYPPPAAASIPNRACPNCGGAIKDDDTFCQSCGSKQK